MFQELWMHIYKATTTHMEQEYPINRCYNYNILNILILINI